MLFSLFEVLKTNDKGIDTTEVNRRNYFSTKFKEVKEALKLGEDYSKFLEENKNEEI